MYATILPADTTPLSVLPIVSIRESAVLTPRGTVAVVVIRLQRELADLDRPDRAYCLDLVRELPEGAGA